jgi:hypothetical protein
LLLKTEQQNAIYELRWAIHESAGARDDGRDRRRSIHRFIAEMK